jgi:hypothetical protein
MYRGDRVLPSSCRSSRREVSATITMNDQGRKVRKEGKEAYHVNTAIVVKMFIIASTFLSFHLW